MKSHTYEILYNVEADHWWFRGRRELIRTQIRSACNGACLRRILDIGCGTGMNLTMLGEFGTQFGIDFSADALRLCRRRHPCRLARGDATGLPFPNRSFDLVTALDVIEHLDDDRAAFREIARVLSPGGLAVVFVPTFMFLWGVQDDVSLHKRRYRLPELRRLLTEAGLRVERSSYVNFFLFLPILLVRKLMKLFRVEVESENNINSPFVNWLFTRLFLAEIPLLRVIRFPFGVSAFAIARKIE